MSGDFVRGFLSGVQNMEAFDLERIIQGYEAITTSNCGNWKTIEINLNLTQKVFL